MGFTGVAFWRAEELERKRGDWEERNCECLVRAAARMQFRQIMMDGRWEIVMSSILLLTLDRKFLEAWIIVSPRHVINRDPPSELGTYQDEPVPGFNAARHFWHAASQPTFGIV